MKLILLFCEIDDFCIDFESQFNSTLLSSCSGKRKRKRKGGLYLSEIMTIVVLFHQSSYRTFKDYYLDKILKYHQEDFPNLVSYNRFVELMPSSLLPLIYYLNSRKGHRFTAFRGQNTGLNFIDSTRLPICHPNRAKRNQVFGHLAAWGKSSMGWFFGFKLHLIINQLGEIDNILTLIDFQFYRLYRIQVQSKS